MARNLRKLRVASDCARAKSNCGQIHYDYGPGDEEPSFHHARIRTAVAATALVHNRRGSCSARTSLVAAIATLVIIQSRSARHCTLSIERIAATAGGASVEPRRQ